MKTSRLWIAIFCATWLWGQNFGRVVARLTDTAGAAAGGVTVQMTLAGGEHALVRAVSDERGFVVFPATPAGVYDLRSVDNRWVCRGVRVSAGMETDLGLVRAGGGREGAVGAEGSVAPEAAGGDSTVFAADWVRRLPILGRQESNLVSVVAGAGTDGMINGLRPTWVNTTLDGVNLVDQFDRSRIDLAAARPRLDQVGEMAVMASRPSAAYGFGFPMHGQLQPSVQIPTQCRCGWSPTTTTRPTTRCSWRRGCRGGAISCWPIIRFPKC